MNVERADDGINSFGEETLTHPDNVSWSHAAGKVSLPNKYAV